MQTGDFWVAAAVLAAFGIYSAAIWRWAARWRPLGVTWLEYVVGALIIVGGTELVHLLHPLTLDEYRARLVVHYCLAALIVAPAQIAQAVRDRAEARRRQQPPAEVRDAA